MTVPGRGGRPRKWASDGDRQRAWRARRSGVAEPPTLETAVGRDPALAEAWSTVHELQAELVRAQRTEERLRRALNDERRKVRVERERADWQEALCRDLAAERGRLLEEVAEASAESAELRRAAMLNDRLLRSGSPVPLQRAPALSRAERRRLNREQRRRRDS